MITVVLQTAEETVLSICAKKGNESYLIQESSEFPHLSELSMSAYDIFADSDVAELKGELNAIRSGLSGEDYAHVSEIIGLADRCVETDGATLAFTPFGWPPP